MDNIYFLMLCALIILACGGLIVGVTNDAVNFLNSAFGSKGISIKLALFLASLGIALGSIYSTGMMQIARSGIFHPEMFVFEEVMFIFTAVMISDILLLDFFNSLGLPTSTTVSIVFELLGASLAMAILKITSQNGDLSSTFNYINIDKATEIIFSILFSVGLSFSLGTIVQWISRFFLSFNFEKKPVWMSALFGAFSITSIFYFIIIDGINGTSFGQRHFQFLGGQTLKEYLQFNAALVITIVFLLWFLFSYVLISKAKINIYKVIIGFGTFGLALAFAGNDLVNFIGVPLAAYQSYSAWSISGVDPQLYNMAVLNKQLVSPSGILFASGIIMIITIWFSKKARYVAETEINLARQGDSFEKFEPNFLSRIFVKSSIIVFDFFNSLLPNSWKNKIDLQFKKPSLDNNNFEHNQNPAFDMVRASVNLVVSGLLIAVATSYTLPLSTTYVTFMVAMGTSLADKAWGAESAVYRVAGVINVIGGWFATAIIAFISASLMLVLISFGKGAAIALLLFVSFLLIFRSYIIYSRKLKKEKDLKLTKSNTVKEILNESAYNISNILNKSKNIYSRMIEGLESRNLALLKKNKKQVEKLIEENENTRNNIFYFIKNLDEKNIEASNFYFSELGFITDINNSLEHITKISYKNINNNFQKIPQNQIEDLKEIGNKFNNEFLKPSISFFENQDLLNIESIKNNKNELDNLINQKIESQIEQIRKEEVSPKNTTLFFSILNETKEFTNSVINLIQLFSSVKL